MIVYPNAKINIGLNILKKRPDNYHNIESIFYPIGICDILEVIPSKSNSFTQTGIDTGTNNADNLATKAYRLLNDIYTLPPAAIHLHKQIPIGAGLGGGSSDGAFTLMLLNELYSLGLSPSQLMNHAASLGSDCPFFILNQPALATGRGEVLNPVELSLKSYWLILVKPEDFVSTSEAYSSVIPGKPKYNLQDALKKNPEEWKNTIKNQFEESIFPNHPKIKSIKNQLYNSGAVYASMSGSGSSVLGLFSSDPENIKNNFEDCFVHTEKCSF
jgi:4-diphosphocytidyl-2-C-methyl-D-erythritol kinase